MKKNLKMEIVVAISAILLIAVIVIVISKMGKVSNHDAKLDLEVVIGSENAQNVENYIKSNVCEEGKECTVNIDEVKTDKAGKYSYTVTVNEETKTGVIEVVTETKKTENNNTTTNNQTANIEVNDNVTFKVGAKDYSAFVKSCNGEKTGCTVTLKNESDANFFNEEGNYMITIVITDKNNNSKEADVSFKVEK